MHTALFLPIFGELAEPGEVARLSAAAEEAGWDGVFVWDHMLYRPPVEAIADPWVTMAAMACATERIRLGPMVTPVPRRRPQKLARECVTLDRLSGGRVILGAGIGGDPGGELTVFDEELDPVARGRLLDSHLDLIVQLWSGEPVRHPAVSSPVEGVRMLPGPVQRPRIPVWLAARYPNRAPLRRAARFDGLFPIALTQPDQLREVIATVAEHRTDPAPFDIAVQGLPDADPAPWVGAGATWWLVRFDPFTVTADEVAGVLAAGPPT